MWEILYAVAAVLKDPSLRSPNKQAEQQQRDALLERIKGKVAEESSERALRDRLPGQQQGTEGTTPVTSESGEVSTSIPIGVQIRAQETK